MNNITVELWNRIENDIQSKKVFIISYDPEDNLNYDLFHDWSVSELILRLDDNKRYNCDCRVVELVSLQVVPGYRQKGSGSRILEAICQWADETNTVLVGDPTDMFGMDLGRLYKFYEKFGFIKTNQVSAAIHAIHAIIRYPKFSI